MKGMWGMKEKQRCLSASHSDWANSPRGAHILSLSASSLFIYLSAYFYPCDQDSDGELCNHNGRNVLHMGLKAEREKERGRIHTYCKDLQRIQLP